MPKEVLYALAFSAFAFAVANRFFAFLAFIYPELDPIHRDQIKAAVTYLESRSLFQISHTTLRRVLAPIRTYYNLGPVAVWAVVFVFFIQNAVVFTVTAAWAVSTHFNPRDLGYAAVVFGIVREGPLLFGAMNAAIGVLGTLFDMASLLVTIALIERATTSSTSGKQLAVHIALDVLVAILSCMWAYVMLGIALAGFYGGIASAVSAFAPGEEARYVAPTIQATLSANPAIWVVVIALGASASLPTLAYLVVLLPVWAFRLVPKPVQVFLLRVLRAVTNDKDSVLKQVSSLVSSLAAIATAVGAWIKYAP